MGSITAAHKHALSAAFALILLMLQIAVIRWSPSELPVRIVLPLTIGLVPLALWPHRHRIGVWVMFVGMLTNFVVILANGGLMPITRSTVTDAIGAERAASYEAGAWISGTKDVLVASGDGHAVALGDSIIVRIGDDGFAASPGDVVVWTGLVVLAAEASIAWQRRPRPESAEQGAASRWRRRDTGSAVAPRRRYRRLA